MNGNRLLQAAGDGDDTVETDNSNGEVVVLLFLFIGLAIGVVITQFLSRTENKLIGAIPYTVILFLIGMALAGYSKSYNSDEFNTSLNDWVRIDADLMLFVFLPPLVFGEAMSLNWHHWRQLFPSCLWLAGPGVLLGTIIFGMLVKMLLPYGWSWLLCFLFSAVLAATDTVSVLSIMNQAGASPKLTMVIVGESLLNDGTGMVLFEIFLSMLQTPVLLAGPTIWLIVKLIFGSVLLGVIIGLITVRWLRSVNRPLKDIDAESQIAITIIVAYLAFYLAQHVLEISGLLCLVGAALMLAWLAPPIILSKETMHHIWGFVEWTFNTIIFLLAGLIIGHRVLDDVVPSDWMYLIVVYLLSTVTRCVVIFVLYPVLQTRGHKLARNEGYFVAFAGLRGALGMALGLLIVDNAASAGISARDASRCFFYIGGVVALTLLINGTCATLILDMLDLGGNDSVQNMLVMDQIKRKLRHKMNRLVDKMEKDLDIAPDEMMDIRMSVSILRPSQLEIEDLLEAQKEANRVEREKRMSLSLSQRLVEEHERAEAEGTLDAEVTPETSHGTSSNPAARVDYDDDLAGVSGDDDSDDPRESEYDDSRLQREKKKNDKNAAKSKGASKSKKSSSGTREMPSPSVDNSVGPYSDTNYKDELMKAASGGPRKDLLKSKSKSVTTPLHAVDNGHNTGVAMTGSSSSRKIQGNENHTEGPPLTSQTLQSYNNRLSLGDVSTASGRYDYAADTIKGVNKRKGQINDQEAPTRTWSVGSYINTNKEGRAGRYSKGSANRANMTDERAARYSTMSFLLDPTRRKTGQINDEMLAYVRTLFLEIVRVKYWKLIEGGKLPRNTHSAQFLLYTVDVGIDDATYNPTKAKPGEGLAYFGSRSNSVASSQFAYEDGLTDYALIEQDINKANMIGRKALIWWEMSMPWWLGSSIASTILEWRESDLENRQVYMLSAFIEAHEHAQQKIHSFVGVDSTNDTTAGEDAENDDGSNQQSEQQRDSSIGGDTDATDTNYLQTPEEIRVKSESAALVQKAKESLKLIEADVVAEIKAKQAAMTVLSKEVELVRTMCEEGLLTRMHAEKFLEEIQEDKDIIDEDESGMFRRRKVRRAESQVDEEITAPSLAALGIR